MGHIAIIKRETGIVETIIVVDDKNFINSETKQEEERVGVEFLKTITGNIYRDGEFTYKQCSYSGKERKNYPGPGFFYDELTDAFIPPKPVDPNTDEVDVKGEYSLNEKFQWSYTGTLKSNTDISKTNDLDNKNIT